MRRTVHVFTLGWGGVDCAGYFRFCIRINLLDNHCPAVPRPTQEELHSDRIHLKYDG